MATLTLLAASNLPFMLTTAMANSRQQQKPTTKPRCQRPGRWPSRRPSPRFSRAVCPSESLLLFHLMSSYRMNGQTSADASDVLYKLVVFALLTAIVPVTAYFGSVRYLFDGEWSCSGYYSGCVRSQRPLLALLQLGHDSEAYDNSLDLRPRPHTHRSPLTPRQHAIRRPPRCTVRQHRALLLCLRRVPGGEGRGSPGEGGQVAIVVTALALMIIMPFYLYI